MNIEPSARRLSVLALKPCTYGTKPVTFIRSATADKGRYWGIALIRREFPNHD